MNGLEAVEIRLSELERTRRLDSEFFKKENLKNSDILEKCSLDSIINLVDISDGNHMEISSKFQEEGVPYFRGQDIHNFFIEMSNAICVDESTYNLPYMRRSHLKSRDVLLSIVGTIGKVAIFTDEKQATCNCKLAILRTKKISPQYLSIFLRCKYGNNQIVKYTRGAVQMGFILEDMQSINVAIFSNNFVNEIEKCVDLAQINIKNSINEYSEAENILLSHLGLAGYTPTKEAIAVKSFSSSFGSSGRLDSEYYLPKYEEIIEKIKNKPYLKLAELGNFTNGSFIPDIFYVEKSDRAYIRIKELSYNSTINDNSVVYIDDDFKMTSETTVLENDFVIATIGNTIGKINLMPYQYNNSFISNNTSRFRLKNKNEKFYFYELLLRSFLVQQQIEREFTQTAQPQISNNSLSNIIVPIVTDDIQSQIAEKIQKSFVLRKKSSELLELAKKAVEMAIEQGESVAMGMLEVEFHANLPRAIF